MVHGAIVIGIVVGLVIAVLVVAHVADTLRLPR